MSDLTASWLLITGKVQGVCFRHYTCETARAAKVAGWVRNRPDGTVEALLQGEKSSVERVIAWCRQGPPAARVDNLQIEKRSCDSRLHSFEVRD